MVKVFTFQSLLDPYKDRTPFTCNKLVNRRNRPIAWHHRFGQVVAPVLNNGAILTTLSFWAARSQVYQVSLASSNVFTWHLYILDIPIPLHCKEAEDAWKLICPSFGLR
jgi:hypothetical protein